MKKTLKLAGALICAILILGVSPGRIHARLTGTNPGTDIFCVGPSGAEICVDVTGNIIPGTTNVGSLGTSSLKFKDLNLAGNAAVAGTLAVTGAITETGILTNNSGVRVNPLNGSTTGFIVTAATSQTADLVEISSPTATSPTVRVTSGGQWLPLRQTVTQIDGLVPAAVGAVIICTNCTIPYSLCTATGTAAAQWARAGSSSVGCGSGN